MSSRVTVSLCLVASLTGCASPRATSPETLIVKSIVFVDDEGRGRASIGVNALHPEFFDIEVMDPTGLDRRLLWRVGPAGVELQVYDPAGKMAISSSVDAQATKLNLAHAGEHFVYIGAQDESGRISLHHAGTDGEGESAFRWLQTYFRQPPPGGVPHPSQAIEPTAPPR